jgi:hypothetical protein
MWLEREVRGKHPNDRRHNVAGDRAIWLDGPDNLDQIGWHQHFFVGFAERGGNGVLARINTAAREGDLARVRAQMLTADGQYDARVGPLGDRNEHCGSNVRLFAKLGQVASERLFEWRLCECFTQSGR